IPILVTCTPERQPGNRQAPRPDAEPGTPMTGALRPTGTGLALFRFSRFPGRPPPPPQPSSRDRPPGPRPAPAPAARCPKVARTRAPGEPASPGPGRWPPGRPRNPPGTAAVPGNRAPARSPEPGENEACGPQAPTGADRSRPAPA